MKTKKYFLILFTILSSFFLTNCEEENIITLKDQVVGKWKNNSEILEINGDYTFKKTEYYTGEVVQRIVEGDFHIENNLLIIENLRMTEFNNIDSMDSGVLFSYMFSNYLIEAHGDSLNLIPIESFTLLEDNPYSAIYGKWSSTSKLVTVYSLSEGKSYSGQYLKQIDIQAEANEYYFTESIEYENNTYTIYNTIAYTYSYNENLFSVDQKGLNVKVLFKNDKMIWELAPEIYIKQDD